MKTLEISTIDMHTGGEPLRVIVDGFPEIRGNTILERRDYVKTHYDHLRKALMWEPRGHADMYGCLITPPNDNQAEFGIIFMHNAGYSTMCGHATIAIGRLARERGWVDKNEFCIDAPCGRLQITVESSDSVSFIGVPSFVLKKNLSVQLESGVSYAYDLAYGGAFYAYIQVSENILPLIPDNYQQIKQLGGQIKRKIIEDNISIKHPVHRELSFLYGTIFIGGPVSTGCHTRNVCVFADEEVDRSPTGSGVMGRLALLNEAKVLVPDEPYVFESITGSRFIGKILSQEPFGPYNAIVPQVSGQAYITGEHTFRLDPQDPFKYGFLLT